MILRRPLRMRSLAALDAAEGAHRSMSDFVAGGAKVAEAAISAKRVLPTDGLPMLDQQRMVLVEQCLVVREVVHEEGLEGGVGVLAAVPSRGG